MREDGTSAWPTHMDVPTPVAGDHPMCRLLTLTLRQLERDGLVDRTVTPSSPPRVDYGLTPAGASLADRAKDLVEWAGEHRDYIAASRERFDAEH